MRVPIWKDARAMTRTRAPATRDLRALFAPRSVAVLGASADPFKWGYWLARGALKGAERRAVHLVNRGGGEILGQRAFRTLAEIPGPVELVVIAVPAAGFDEAVDQALAAGAKALVGISAGLGETGADGLARERAVVERVRAAGAVLLGPNCMGLLDAEAELDIGWNELPRGSIALVSQSGNVALELGLLLEGYGLGFSRFASLGNQADLEAAELVDALAEPRADARDRSLPRGFSRRARIRRRRGARHPRGQACRSPHRGRQRGERESRSLPHRRARERRGGGRCRLPCRGRSPRVHAPRARRSRAGAADRSPAPRAARRDRRRRRRPRRDRSGRRSRVRARGASAERRARCPARRAAPGAGRDPKPGRHGRGRAGLHGVRATAPSRARVGRGRRGPPHRLFRRLRAGRAARRQRARGRAGDPRDRHGHGPAARRAHHVPGVSGRGRVAGTRHARLPRDRGRGSDAGPAGRAGRVDPALGVPLLPAPAATVPRRRRLLRGARPARRRRRPVRARRAVPPARRRRSPPRPSSATRSRSRRSACSTSQTRAASSSGSGRKGSSRRPSPTWRGDSPRRGTRWNGWHLSPRASS